MRQFTSTVDELEVRPIRRVLVVDDDPSIDRLLRTRLEHRGYSVESAADGEAALRCIEQSAPDLVFLDVSMPGLSGLEVLERIRGRELDLAIIMTTAFGSEEVAIDALRGGADDYLRKPFRSQEFQAVLGRAVARLELERQNAALRSQLDEKRRQLEAELARAAEVQMELLPRERPILDGFELAGRCLPAREVGGDFYDWMVCSPGGLTITIGDVMGKGMPAALLMATVRAALRAVARHFAPGTALELAGRALADDLAQSGSFVTLFHAQLDTAHRCLTFADAGHGHGFVRRADGRCEGLAPRGLPLGVVPDEQYAEGSVELGAGDALVLYSDGLLDAQADGSPSQAALAERLVGAADADEMVRRLMALAEVGGPQTDDLTVVVLLCTGGG